MTGRHGRNQAQNHSAAEDSRLMGERDVRIGTKHEAHRARVN